MFARATNRGGGSTPARIRETLPDSSEAGGRARVHRCNPKATGLLRIPLRRCCHLVFRSEWRVARRTASTCHVASAARRRPAQTSRSTRIAASISCISDLCQRNERGIRPLVVGATTAVDNGRSADWITTAGRRPSCSWPCAPLGAVIWWTSPRTMNGSPNTEYAHLLRELHDHSAVGRIVPRLQRFVMRKVYGTTAPGPPHSRGGSRLSRPSRTTAGSARRTAEVGTGP